MATANNEFFEALAALEKERGLPADYLIEKIKAAIVIAVKKDYEVEDDNVVVDIDPELGAFRASLPYRCPDRKARHPSGPARGRAQPAVQRDAVPCP